MTHLISNNIKRGKPVRVLHMQAVLNLPPDVEFETSNNEEKDENELADKFYQPSN